MLVVGHVLLVVGRQIFVGDLDLTIRSVAGGKCVFEAHLFVGLGKMLVRLVGTHLRGTPQHPLQPVIEQLPLNRALDPQD